MVGNQVIASTIGLVPVIGDVGIAMFKTNFRNAALLEEYLRIRGEELLKAQSDRVEDPTVVKPGAGKERAEKIPGKSPSLNFFRRSTKNVPVAGETPIQSEDEPSQKNQKKLMDSPKSNGGKGKGKGKQKS